MEEERYEIFDPRTGRSHLLSRVDMWRLTFGAAGSFCHEETRGMVGMRKRRNFASCMHHMAYGVPSQEMAQRVIDNAMFPVDEYVERLEIRRAARALPYVYPEMAV